MLLLVRTSVVLMYGITIRPHHPTQIPLGTILSLCLSGGMTWSGEAIMRICEKCTGLLTGGRRSGRDLLGKVIYLCPMTVYTSVPEHLTPRDRHHSLQLICYERLNNRISIILHNRSQSFILCTRPSRWALVRQVSIGPSHIQHTLKPTTKSTAQ